MRYQYAQKITKFSDEETDYFLSFDLEDIDGKKKLKLLIDQANGERPKFTTELMSRLSTKVVSGTGTEIYARDKDEMPSIFISEEGEQSITIFAPTPQKPVKIAEFMVRDGNIIASSIKFFPMNISIIRTLGTAQFHNLSIGSPSDEASSTRTDSSLASEYEAATPPFRAFDSPDDFLSPPSRAFDSPDDFLSPPSRAFDSPDDFLSPPSRAFDSPDSVETDASLASSVTYASYAALSPSRASSHLMERPPIEIRTDLHTHFTGCPTVTMLVKVENEMRTKYPGWQGVLYPIEMLQEFGIHTEKYVSSTIMRGTASGNPGIANLYVGDATEYPSNQFLPLSAIQVV